MARADEHASDQEKFPDLHVPGCLTGHESGREKKKPGYLTEKSCNYRWQGFKQALDQSRWYNNKAPAGKTVMAVKWGSAGKDVKATPRAKDAWNVSGSGENFRTQCNKPYWHEAHHIVPHGELRDAIGAVGKGDGPARYRTLIRQGLLEEEYNLNDKLNMIILPMAEQVAAIIGLPRHRQTPAHWSHKAYSAYVRGKLDKVFKPIRGDESKHQAKPKYKQCKRKIVATSRTVRSEIKAKGKVGTKSLDEAFVDPAEL